MKHSCTTVLLVGLIFAATTCCAQDSLLRFDFEQDEGDWITLDPQALLGLTWGAENVYKGTGALELQYGQASQAPGEGEGMPGAIVLPIEAGLPGLQSLELALKTTVSTPMVLGLQEIDESNYLCMVFCTAGQWHPITLSLDEFALDENSLDENGRLDTELIKSLALIDASFFFRSMDQGEIPIYVEPAAPQTIWVDEVNFRTNRLGEETAGLPPEDGQAVVIDTCDRPTFKWLPLGGREIGLTYDTKNAAANGCYRIDYQVPAGTIFALLRSIKVGSLAGTRRLELSTKCSVDMSLVLTIEESDGSRYSLSVPVGGVQSWQRLIINYTQLRLGDDSQDENGQLDPDQVKSLGLVDLSALTTLQETQNTLWLDDVIAVKDVEALAAKDEDNGPAPSEVEERTPEATRDAERAAVLVEEGLVAKREDQLDEAESKLRAAIELDPDNVEAHWGLAWTLVAQERESEAVEEFRIVVELAPEGEMKQEAQAALYRME